MTRTVLTHLELDVLRSTAKGDPWKSVGCPGRYQPRFRSQALGRLRQRGLVEVDHRFIGGWLITEKGKKYLKEEKADD
jgi:hypothetical protein